MRLALLLTVVLAFPTLLLGQDQPPAYGESISLTDAKAVMAAAEEYARSNNWPVAITIVDNAGFLVMFQRLENTQLGSVEIAIQKAKTAALFRRSTKAFEDRVAEGGVNLKLLRLPGGLPMEGGLPIIVDQKLIGAIGVSGVTSTQDGMIAQAGIDAISTLNPAQSEINHRESDKASVAGTVTLDGKPLGMGIVIFVPQSRGRPAGAITNANGAYKFSNPLEPGDYTVRISTKRDESVQPDGKVLPAQPETIPARYNSRSELTTRILEGNNEFNFDLASEN
ncbi:heme-binding protein [Thalassoglobus sp. JC818]|uniref:heme-binding protein n=1 Tax=Thalassoglobus sp. JC818 TaxID=3232136 RepID=UPI003459AAC9